MSTSDEPPDEQAREIEPPAIGEGAGAVHPSSDADAERAAAVVADRAPSNGVRRHLRVRPRGETMGVVVLVVLALICAGLIVAVIAKTQRDAALAACEAAAYTPPALAPLSGAEEAMPVIAFVSDETAARAASGVTASIRWPHLVADALDADATTAGVAGGGYTTTGSGDRTFVSEARDVPADADLIVFVGGAADAGATPLQIARAATRAFAAAKARAPDAALVVVGPIFTPSSVTPAELESLTSALAGSARIAGGEWVDPVSRKWLPGVTSAAGLDAAAERTIATRMAAVLRSAAA